MKYFSICYSTVCILSCIHLTSCIEPISGLMAGFAAAFSVVLSGYQYVNCQFNECCDKKSISLNKTALTHHFNTKLYGQHLVHSSTIKHLTGHLLNPSPNKALALSFHGWTGTGKNYVTKLIADSIYSKGMKSKYVHMISTTKEFPHDGMVPFYQDQVKSWIEGNISACETSMFIFDEMDKMPSGLIDTIKPYLDYYTELAGVDYRKAIFIFLSNTGGDDINSLTLKHYAEGKPREDLKLIDMENILSKAALNDQRKGGMWHSSLITKHLITAFIPFLPLERRHVKDCIKDSLLQKKYYAKREYIDESHVTDIADELTYFPSDLKIFSTTGCKRVQEKMYYIME